MNRVIKFRGKDAITGNWAYGFYYTSKGHHIIRDENDNECIVLKETVGQFTGLKDKNGKEIYEGDILVYYGNRNIECYWDKEGARFMVRHGQNTENLTFCEPHNIEIIGNVHETPNLLTINQ